MTDWANSECINCMAKDKQIRILKKEAKAFASRKGNLKPANISDIPKTVLEAHDTSVLRKGTAKAIEDATELLKKQLQSAHEEITELLEVLRRFKRVYPLESLGYF